MVLANPATTMIAEQRRRRAGAGSNQETTTANAGSYSTIGQATPMPTNTA